MQEDGRTFDPKRGKLYLIENMRLKDTALLYEMWFIIDLASNYLKTLRTRPDDALDFFEMFDNNVKKVYEFVYFK